MGEIVELRIADHPAHKLTKNSRAKREKSSVNAEFSKISN